MENYPMNDHCVKSVQIQSFFWSVLPVFELNMEIYSVNLRIQSECEKIRTRKNSASGRFSGSGCFSKNILYLTTLTSSNKICEPQKYKEI